MTAPTITRPTFTSARWLCILALAACDDPDPEFAEDASPVLEAEDEAQDAIIVSEPELRDLCQLAGPESEALPPADGPDDFTAEADPALGVCSTGSMKDISVVKACGSCWHDITQESGYIIEHWKQFCYSAPSPVSCGCEPRWLWSWSCEVGCG